MWEHRIDKLVSGVYKLGHEMRATHSAMVASGKSPEQIGKALVALRNEAKVSARAIMSSADPVYGPLAVKFLEIRNINKYWNPVGPTAKQLLKKYGSWDVVVEAAYSTSQKFNAVLLF